jgi:Transposase IS116/IS110/IS902 family
MARSNGWNGNQTRAPHPMIRVLAQVRGLGIETADMLAHEAFSRRLRDRRAVARYGGLTGTLDESGARRREKGLAKTGNARVRRHPQGADYCAGPQAARRAAAAGNHRRIAARRRAASRVVSAWSTSRLAQRIQRLSSGLTGVDSDPRWRVTRVRHGSHAVLENGPAAPEPRRRCAWLHHGPVSSKTSEYKTVGAIFRAHRRVPLGSSPGNVTVTTDQNDGP